MPEQSCPSGGSEAVARTHYRHGRDARYDGTSERHCGRLTAGQKRGGGEGNEENGGDKIEAAEAAGGGREGNEENGGRR